MSAGPSGLGVTASAGANGSGVDKVDDVDKVDEVDHVDQMDQMDQVDQVDEGPKIFFCCAHFLSNQSSIRSL